MSLFTHGEPPLRHRCRSCDASTAEIERLRRIIADQDQRIIRAEQRRIEFLAQMEAQLARLRESQQLLKTELNGGRR